MAKRFLPFRVDVPWGDKLMGYLVAAFDSLTKAVTNDHIIRQAIGTGDTKVFHGLGHQVETWEIVDQNANAVIWQSPTVNATPETFILLKASAPVTASVRFT